MKISVVMGVYEAAREELQSTLDSILGQTFRDFELIVVDDGSREPVSIADPRARVIRHEENRGLTRALIEGCAAARGEYIARHDAGDISFPTRFEKQAAMLDAGATFVSCWTEYVGPELEPLWIARDKGSNEAPRRILQPDRTPALLDGPTHHGSVMFRRDAYERAGGYRDAFRYGQDYDLWYRIAAIGTFQTVPEVLYRARITASSISSAARDAQMKFAALSLEAMNLRHRGQAEDSVLAAARSIGNDAVRTNPAPGLYFIGEALRRNGDARARRYFREAIAASPWSPRAWVRLAQSLLLRK